MIIKMLTDKDINVEKNKELRFGFDDIEYLDVLGYESRFYGNMMHIWSNEYVFRIHVITRDSNKLKHPVETYRVLTPDIYRNEMELMNRALQYDYGFSKDEYEIVK